MIFTPARLRSTGRVLFESAGKQLTVYLKRHYQLPRWHGLLRDAVALGRLVARHAGAGQSRMGREQGLPVPKVVAAGEFLGPWGKLQSFLPSKN